MNSTSYRYNFIKALVFLFVFMINQTYAGRFELLNVSPNLIFVLVLCGALVENKSSNITYSLIFGLLFDFFNGKILGVYTILFVGISFVLSELYHNYFENMTTVQTFFSVLGCLLYSFFLAMFFGLKDGGFFSLFLRVSLVEFVYNAILSIIVTVIYKKILIVRKSAWRV